jgi:hypothetical protein
MTDNDDNTSRLGESLSISTDENFVIAGAPYTNVLTNDGSTRYYNEGLIKIYVWDPSTFKYGILSTLTAPTDGSTANENLNFGWASQDLRTNNRPRQEARTRNICSYQHQDTTTTQAGCTCTPGA